MFLRDAIIGLRFRCRSKVCPGTGVVKYVTEINNSQTHG